MLMHRIHKHKDIKFTLFGRVNILLALKIRNKFIVIAFLNKFTGMVKDCE